LHADAVTDVLEQTGQDKVVFESYCGVAPSRYENFFRYHRNRKKSGRFIDHDRDRSSLIPIGAPVADELLIRLRNKINEVSNAIFQQEGE
jgi:hypothetical protein